MQQLQDVGEYAHRRDVCARARPLHHERRPRVALRRERDDVVAALGAGERVIARELAHLGARPFTREDADVAQHRATRPRPLQPPAHRRVVHPDQAVDADILNFHRRSHLTRQNQELSSHVLS